MILQNLFIGFLKLYQWLLAPIFVGLGVQCRFNPSCSTYFIGAVKVHGVFKGSFLGICRLLRCHPLCKGGDDFVPEKIK